MRFAIDIPNFGPFGDPHLAVAFAREAEAAGWDAIWIWDHILRDPAQVIPFADPWLVLAAMAAATERIRLGPMVVALPRRRPWHVAREAVTLDQLSGGRVTLGAGLGTPPAEFTAFGEEGDLRLRAEKLDEGLAVVSGLWTGEPFEFAGRHYRIERQTFAPRPLQQPRIPIWLAGTWPIRAPFRRAARWDGVWPLVRDEQGTTAAPTPQQVREIVGFVGEVRGSLDGFDVLISGYTPEPAPGSDAADFSGDRPRVPDMVSADVVAEYAEAGATWWTERINPRRGDVGVMLERVRQGPPRIA